MLVLARKIGQSVIIGRDIKVTVLEISGDTVRIGLQAPQSLEIYREEIFKEIMEENASAIADKKGMQEILSKNYLNKK